jgi:deazaflavin-dependent oxidoreductase (nitroreductase family)
MTSVAGIPQFDPNAPRGAFYRGYGCFVRSRVGYQLAMRVGARVDPTLLRLTHGRVGMGIVLPSANLTTTGAKSGLPRTVAVLYFSDGADVILIASSFGRDQHPAWYRNLKATPEAELESRGGSGRYLAAEVTEPAEHERLFALANKVYPGYADYKVRTAAVGRRIPIMRLTPVAAG